jgi:hypothetical protein
MAVLAAALIAWGCSPADATERPGPAGSEEAVRLAWHAFGCESEPPEVVWRSGGMLDCASGRGWKDRWGRCVSGLSHPGGRLVEVAWDGRSPPSGTSLVHELGHSVLFRQGSPDGDPEHKGPMFAPGGEVERVNLIVRDAGL